MMAAMKLKGDLTVTCPQCGHEHKVSAELGGGSFPSTTLSYAQKVFPFWEVYGVGVFGAGLLMGKTPYFAVRELESECRAAGNGPADLNEATEKIADRFKTLVHGQVASEGKSVEAFPDGWSPIGFQGVGYLEGKATSLVVRIGKDVVTERHQGPGANMAGDTKVVETISSLYKEPTEKPVIENFSLQDAVRYAEFLISTTASHQRFSRTIPKVGGEIDVGLVTPFEKFTWIKRKRLIAADTEVTYG